MKENRMNKISIKELTICIPVRIDSDSRRRNLEAILSFFSEYVDCSVLVLEADEHPLIENVKDKKNVQYFFVEDVDPVFFRTRYINLMLKMVSTPLAAIWDSDVIAYPDQLKLACELLLKKDLTLVYPYDGHFIYVDQYYAEIFYRSNNLQLLDSTYFSKRLFHGSGAVGDAYIVQCW